MIFPFRVDQFSDTEENCFQKEQDSKQEVTKEISLVKKKCRENSTVYPGPEIIKLFSCSTQLSMKFHLVIKIQKTNIKPFSCSTQLSMKEVLKNGHYFKIYKQDKFYAQLS